MSHTQLQTYMAQANTPMLLNSILINLSKLLRSDEIGSEENIIIGEDFNCPLDITLDIWRLKNLTLQSFTWGRCSPFIFCRLDYWLISDKLHDLVTKVDIIPFIKSALKQTIPLYF